MHKSFYIIILVISSCSHIELDDSGCCNEAIELIDDMQYLEANKYLKVCIKENPLDFCSLNYNAIAFIYLNDFGKALDMLNSAYDIDNESSFLMTNFALLYSKIDSTIVAEKYLKLALKIDPSNAAAYSSLGLIAFRNGQDDRALELYDKSIKANSEKAECYINRGGYYHFHEKYRKSLRDLNKAVKLSKTRFARHNAYYFLGLLHRDLRNFDKSISSFSTSISLLPEFPENYYYRGLSYSATHEYQNALDDFEKARELGTQYDIDTLIMECRFMLKPMPSNS